MQLFNGLNMWIIKFYRLDFETPETGNGKPEEVDYSEKLNAINQKINELKNDNNPENDKAARDELNKILNNGLDWFINSLPPDQKENLKNSIKNVLDFHKNEENFKTEYEWLINLATALGVEWYESTEESDRKHWINWDINDESIQLLEDWKTTDWKFYDKGKMVETAPEWVNTVIENINKQETTLKTLLSNDSQYKDNEWLKRANRLLKNIQDIIKNPVDDNVKLLQQYIFDNLDDNMLDESNWNFKETFKKKNKYNESTKQFDWKFWETTLAGLNKVLEKTWKYIEGFKNQPSEWTEGEPFKSVKIKNEIPLPQWNTPISAADLLESLPNGTTAEFKGNAWIDKSKTDEQEVTVVVRSWDKTKEITIIATVDTTSKKVGLKIKEAWNPATPEATKPTAPEKITVNGEVHSIATSSPADKFWWALYYVNNWENPEALNNTLDENGDREYLMQVNNETYKVKLDQNWNLKPLAINYESGAKLLLKNNPSCIAYLQSKIPANLPGNPRIARNPNMEDYVIRSTTDRWVKWLTIEPMTLDGKWLVWSNLWNNLALLNFTNFLRWNENIDNLRFKNDNPDLKLDNGKLYVRIKKWTRLADDSKSGKWYEVNLSKFWISQNALEDFIKYNNSEDWNDNWDKKKDNKGYTKIDFPNISGPAGPAATETTTTTVPITQPTVNHENGGNPATTPQHTEITTPAPTTQNTDIFPNVPNLSKEEKIKLREILSNPLELWNFVDGKFVFKEWLEKTDNTNKKYIEITVNNKNVKINEWQENISELWYKSWVEDNLWYLYMWEFKNGNMEWQWTYTWANWNKFDGEYETNNIKKWKFTLATPQEIKWEYDVEKDDKWLKIISEKNKWKYINTKTWGIEDWQEQPTDDQFSLTISDENLTKIWNDLWENMFIKKIEGWDVSYDLEKAKKYLNSCRWKARNLLQSNVAYIAAVQILLNDKADDNSKKVDISGKFDDETKNRVEEFQKNYNEHLPTWATKLIQDGKPGKNTLTVLLDGRLNSVTLTETPVETPVSTVRRNETYNPDPENVTQYWLKWLNMSGREKQNLGISANTPVYVHENVQDSYFYKNGNKIMRMRKSEPYVKYETTNNNPPKISSGPIINLCESWKQMITKLVWDSSVNISFNNKDYFFKKGSLSYPLWSLIRGERCWLKNLNNKLKTLSIAMTARSMCRNRWLNRIIIDVNWNLAWTKMENYREKEEILIEKNKYSIQGLNKSEFVNFINRELN